MDTLLSILIPLFAASLTLSLLLTLLTARAGKSPGLRLGLRLALHAALIMLFMLWGTRQGSAVSLFGLYMLPAWAGCVVSVLSILLVVQAARLVSSLNTLSGGFTVLVTGTFASLCFINYGLYRAECLPAIILLIDMSVYALLVWMAYKLHAQLK